jgi:hypothetical protein
MNDSSNPIPSRIRISQRGKHGKNMNGKKISLRQASYLFAFHFSQGEFRRYRVHKISFPDEFTEEQRAKWGKSIDVRMVVDFGDYATSFDKPISGKSIPTTSDSLSPYECLDLAYSTTTASTMSQ